MHKITACWAPCTVWASLLCPAGVSCSGRDVGSWAVLFGLLGGLLRGLWACSGSCSCFVARSVVGSLSVLFVVSVAFWMDSVSLVSVVVFVVLCILYVYVGSFQSVSWKFDF